MHEKRVEEYYDYTFPFYKIFWHKGTNGIHYGFWDEETNSHTEALINTNKTVADTGKIKYGDKVLDAGCGVGGTSIWIAKNRGAHVTGG